MILDDGAIETHHFRDIRLKLSANGALFYSVRCAAQESSILLDAVFDEIAIFNHSL